MGTKVDLTGKQFGLWKVLRESTKQERPDNAKNEAHWVCECQCENKTIKIIGGHSLRRGNTKSCGCNKKPNLVNKMFGTWKVIREATYEERPNKEFVYWLCECQCKHKTKQLIRTTYLLSGHTKSCGKCNLDSDDDIVGKMFGSWKVIRKANKNEIREGETHSHFLCECQCELNTQRIIRGYHLRNGNTLSCGHDNKPKDLTGINFGKLKVIRRATSTETPINNTSALWLCECQCEDKNTVIVSSTDLVKGRRTSCGCNQWKDITGKMFGRWKVIKPGKIGGDTLNGHNQFWICECQCENKTIREIDGTSLRLGRSKSCGCLRKYDRAADKSRTSEQIELWEDKDKLENELISFEEDYGRKPNTVDVMKMVGVGTTGEAVRMLKVRGLEHLVDIGSIRSSEEIQLEEIIKSVCNGKLEIKHSVRNILDNNELDIYIPDIRLAVEFNGMYWHSDEYKHKLYHQEKVLEARNKGVALYNVYEYEFRDKKAFEKIERELNSKINGFNKEIYTDECTVVAMSKEMAQLFMECNSLDSYVSADISIGLTYKGKTVMMISFKELETHWQIVNVAYKTDIKIHGGIDKIIKQLKLYGNKHIIVQNNLDKDIWSNWKDAGFKFLRLCAPDSIWWREQGSEFEVIRGEKKHTDEEMKKLGYKRIFNSGSAVYIYESNR